MSEMPAKALDWARYDQADRRRRKPRAQADRFAAIERFFIAYASEFYAAPTVREVQVACGLSAETTVGDLAALAKAGVLIVTSPGSRSRRYVHRRVAAAIRRAVRK